LSKTVLIPYTDRSYAEPYARAIEAAGAKALLEEARPGLRIGECSGLLLTGGTDVTPSLYGETAGPETQQPEALRDEVETALIEEALSHDIPVLAICRGMQLLNVQLGGSLIQHLADTGRHVQRTKDKSLPAHAVTIAPGTMLASIANRQTWDVNSRHHQAVGRLGNGLRVGAWDAKDHTIEAIELPERRFVVGVQWHPEDQAEKDAEQRKLFQSFAAVL
jgi:putative glutamine amidotransferase